MKSGHSLFSKDDSALRGQSLGRPSFDTKLDTELLENTTISTLSMNERFDTVNGTESRSFNIYHFQNKLVFFLPYSLSLGLAIPPIVLRLIALYVQNECQLSVEASSDYL
jgi:hypothetical protein